ncbi:TetR/AcrR family transcriptional regulator [Vibrio sonorensis]|uniref:TetR/AcrR family transcriptional regulator n=1 Tax=Vibrio sonorensis TaxID=1004316 RepID=UPI0008D98000|nr:TetR/AcrR family transcriptional regulator [Vibrio sonorensis]
MAKKSKKVDMILDVAIELLRSEGDYGVTMRKVASIADMSLSNVQYYFKTKDELLKAMADRYFQQCLEEVASYPILDKQEDLKPLLARFLSHGHELSDMCRIFREYWAISTRNETVDDYLREYYCSMVALTQDKLRPLAACETSLSKAVSVLIPFVEGYTISAKSLSHDLQSMIATLDTILLEILSSEL